MRLSLVVAVAGLLASGLAAHADTLSVFTITGATQFWSGSDQNTISGTAVIDTTTGVVDTISFTAAGIAESGLDAQSGTDLVVGADNLRFDISGNTLIGFTGDNFNLNAFGTPLNDIFVGQVLYDGPYTPPVATSVTTEPASLLLLGTGLLGLTGTLRRRIL